MRRLVIVCLLAATGCVASHPIECDAPCATVIRCEPPYRLRSCEIGTYHGVFCESPEAIEPLEDACARACVAEGTCGVDALTDPDLAVRVCDCPAPDEIGELGAL